MGGSAVGLAEKSIGWAVKPCCWVWGCATSPVSQPCVIGTALLLPAVLVERAAPALGGAAALFFCFCLFCFVLFVLFCFYRFIFCKLSEPALQPIVLGTHRRAAATLQVSISIPSAPGCDSIHPLGTPMPMSCPALPAPCRETWTGSTAWQHLSISPGAL